MKIRGLKILTTLFAIATIAFLAAIALASYPPPRPIIKVVASAATPEVLGTNTLHFHTISFRGMKAARTNNTGTVWIQFNSTNTSAAYLLPAGAELDLHSDNGYDAGDFYIDVETDGDGVVALISDVFLP